MEQKFSSKDTSINKTKLPKIYKAKIPAGSSVLDYGCGKYVDHLKRKAEKMGWKWHGYDPFNYVTEIENQDYVLCSNVLNVIAEDEVVDDVIRECIKYANKSAVFTVFERDKDGIGKQTGGDQWQRNEKREEYVNRMKKLGFEPVLRQGMIWIDVA